MNKIRIALGMLLLAAAGSSFAWGGGRPHSHFGVYLGPAWGPWYYPPPVVYYPSQPVIVQSAPPVYVEAGDAAPSPQAAPATGGNYWYYCAESKTYYPYVKECPGGWRTETPQPPPPPSAPQR